MKKLLIGLMLVSFMVSAEPEIGRYKIEVTTYVSLKTNKYMCWKLHLTQQLVRL